VSESPGTIHPEPTVVPQIMGVVNASVDSLTGGVDAIEARNLAREMVEAGASVLDVGGQSLRTDQSEKSVADELAVVVPVLEAVVPVAGTARVSIDTYRSPVANAAIGLGAAIVNDPSGLIDPDMAGVVADTGVDLVLAYSRATPKVRMARSDMVADPVGDCREFLGERLDALLAAGVKREQVIIDVGPDLGKSPDQTISVLRSVNALRSEFGDQRFLWAVSRKDFVGALVHRPPSGRAAGTFGALAALALEEGDIVRVHDVAGTADFFAVRGALAAGVEGPLELPESVRYG
jgi:dihydropteroate synthase